MERSTSSSRTSRVAARFSASSARTDASTLSAPQRRRGREDGARRLQLLSSREREVLRPLALGFTQKEMAKELGVSPKTIDTYRSRLGQKLACDSRSALVRLALESGLVSRSR